VFRKRIQLPQCLEVNAGVPPSGMPQMFAHEMKVNEQPSINSTGPSIERTENQVKKVVMQANRLFVPVESGGNISNQSEMPKEEPVRQERGWP